MRRAPFHPIGFSLYPVLALLAHNIREIEWVQAIRPAVFIVATAVVLLALLQVAMRNGQRAALVVSLLALLVFTYGHIYYGLRGVEFLGISLGRHRFLLPVYLALGAGGTWVAVARLRETARITVLMNSAALVALALPLAQIAIYGVGVSRAHAMLGGSAGVAAEHWPQGAIAQPMPDIYYIILDGYTRADALQRDFGFDNQPFLDELSRRGFYVAECSRSNYAYTLGSLTSALNLDYVSDLSARLGDLGVGEEGIWILLKRSLVREQLESVGYLTVAFETGYEWSRVADADIYLGRGQESFLLQRLQPFEAMLIRTSALMVVADIDRIRSSSARVDLSFPHEDHVSRQLFILDQIPRIADIPEPTFAFIHMLIPHPPYVFGADGEILTDPAYYSAPMAMPVNEEYWRRGYLGGIQFVSQRLLSVIDEVVEASERTPIIIIQGDHGLRDENRWQILNVYLLPEGGADRLYPSITPVNSFRIIFDVYFGAHYGLLPDLSIADGGLLVAETAEECLRGE